MRKALEDLRLAGSTRLCLSVESSNISTARLWKKHGFEWYKSVACDELPDVTHDFYSRDL